MHAAEQLECSEGRSTPDCCRDSLASPSPACCLQLHPHSSPCIDVVLTFVIRFGRVAMSSVVAQRSIRSGDAAAREGAGGSRVRASPNGS